MSEDSFLNRLYGAILDSFKDWLSAFGYLISALGLGIVTTIIASLLGASIMSVMLMPDLSALVFILPLAIYSGFGAGLFLAAPTTLFTLPVLSLLLRRFSNIRFLILPIAGGLSGAATILILAPSPHFAIAGVISGIVSGYIFASSLDS